MYQAFASCPKYIELLLKDELLNLGCYEVYEKQSGVIFQATPETLLETIIWSRLSSRIFVMVGEVDNVVNKEDLYQCCYDIEWFDLTQKPINTISVRFQGVNSALKNTMYSQQVCKDAICDYYVRKHGQRPHVAKKEAELNIYARLKHKRLTIYQDIAGYSLHQRGYRLDRTLAPLRENLAAALLVRSGWAEKSQQNYNLIDPMCGSGTFLTEGWMIACDVAPHIELNSSSLQLWSGFNGQKWKTLIEAAHERKKHGEVSFKGQIIGIDHHQKSIHKAQENIQRLNASSNIHCQWQTLEKFRIPPRRNLIVCNPPYGVRLQKNNLNSWRHLSHWLSHSALGSEAVIVTPDSSFGFMIGFREEKSWSFINGTIDIQLRYFYLEKKNRLNVPEGQYFAVPGAAQMLVNRLKKNKKLREKWAQEKQTNAWRLYDADLPEFAVAIDIYADYIHIQEYKAPKSIEPKIARNRLSLVIIAVQAILQPDMKKISVKTRQKQKGNNQYSINQEHTDNFLTVHECGRNYLVNLFRYLDTGLFLDHRWLRNHIQQKSHGKKVLNLFSYTGSISVAAALGGAVNIVSVDTSKTYLQWSEKNFLLNKVSLSGHYFIRSDSIKYVNSTHDQFDIIVIDPPTYSNSHSRDTDWDVQRDHKQLLLKCVERLNPDGIIYFSNNFKKFVLDVGLNKMYCIENLTDRSLDMDFASSQKIHHCFRLTLKREKS